MDRLQEILNSMEVPEMRKTDYRWLSRNLFIKNENHPDLEEAMRIIIKKLKSI